MEQPISSYNKNDLDGCEFQDIERHLILQSELNDLVGDLQLSKSTNCLLQEWNLLALVT